MISIIIPVYNEEKRISALLTYLMKQKKGNNFEILVVDGHSSDQTVAEIEKLGISYIISDKRGRAAQMNAGVEQTKGELLYFVHADTVPPASFVSDIHKSISNGFDAGCYRSCFDSDHPLLKVNAYFTKFDRLMCRGGDQSLFIKRSLFNKLGGFKNEFLIMEDFEMIDRLRRNCKFEIIQKDVLISARKYDKNSYMKVNVINLIIFLMYFSGASQQTMIHAYKNLIRETRFG